MSAVLNHAASDHSIIDHVSSNNPELMEHGKKVHLVPSLYPSRTDVNQQDSRFRIPQFDNTFRFNSQWKLEYIMSYMSTQPKVKVKLLKPTCKYSELHAQAHQLRPSCTTIPVTMLWLQQARLR